MYVLKGINPVAINQEEYQSRGVSRRCQPFFPLFSLKGKALTLALTLGSFSFLTRLQLKRTVLTPGFITR